jgi:hypothetical protein
MTCKHCERADCPTLTMPEYPVAPYPGMPWPDEQWDIIATRQRAFDDCRVHTVDWRERALAAEKERDALRAQQPQATCWICRAKVATGVPFECGCEVAT